MSISELDKVYYNTYIRQHDLAKDLVETQGEKFYQLVDYLHKGGLDLNHSKEIEAMDEVNFIRAMKGVCRNNLWRAVDTAAHALKQAEQNGPDVDEEMNEADFKASLQNFYSSSKFVEELEKAQGTQDSLDMMVSKTDGSGLPAPPTEEEIKFRNWLARRSQYDMNIAEILKWFGNFYAYANELKRKNYQSSSEVADVTIGNHLPDLVPSEFANCGIEELDILFDYGYAMSELLQFERTSISEGKGGPIVLGLDLSGSMSERLGGQKKFNIAAGFAMAVTKAMDDDGRRCQMFGFRKEANTLFNGSEPIAERLQRILELGPSGGTSLQQALLHSFEMADADDDVLIVTDGVDWDLNVERLNAAKGERKVSTLLVSELSPETVKMKEVSDSFIVANSVDGFEQLMTKAIG